MKILLGRILNRNDYKVRQSLELALQRLYPNAKIDTLRLTTEFLSVFNQDFDQWEDVPDAYACVDIEE